MHLVHPPSNYMRDPEESGGQRSCPDCSSSPRDATPVCVLSVPSKHVAQQCLCTGAAHSALARHTRLTTLLRELPMESRLPVWPSQAAAGLTERSQCSSSMHIHQSLISSAQNVYLCSTNEILHACTPAVKAWHTLHSFGLLCNCDCPRKRQSKEGMQSITFPQSTKI